MTNACPKVYLAAGNCFVGNVDGPACMTTAWLHAGGAEQICGYAHVTFFGFMGWGVKSLFEEARCSFAEAYYLQNQLLLWVLLNTRDGTLATMPVDPADLSRRRANGYLWDRDLVAFYGDPAYRVTFPEERRSLDVVVFRYFEAVDRAYGIGHRRLLYEIVCGQ